MQFKIIFYYVLITAILFAMPAQAVMYAPKDVPDPTQNGESCKVGELLSYGSYIYFWPSAVDLVFIDTQYAGARWTCNKSGYAAFSKDFNSLSETEITKIQQYLASNYSGEMPSGGALLDHMEKIYQLRDMNHWFWAEFYRTRALADDQTPEKAKSNRLTAAKHIKDHLQVTTEIDAVTYMSGHYLLGRYEYLYGDKEVAAKQFDLVRNYKWQDKEGKKQTGNSYLENLIAFHEAGLANGSGSELSNFLRSRK